MANLFSSEVEAISMEGFQVVSGEYFARAPISVIPTCTIWSSGITFNRMALTAMNNCERVRIDIHIQKRGLLVVPVTAKDRDGIVWRKNIKEYAPRRIEAVRFSAKVYEMWEWDADYVYRAVGRIVTADGKVMLLFDFSVPEQWKSKGRKSEK